VLGCVVGGLRGVPHFGRWLATHRSTGSRFFGEFPTGEAVSEVVMLGVGASADLGTLGAVRASQLFYVPPDTSHGGIYLVVVPEGAQVCDQPHKIRRIMVAASIGVASVAVALMVVGVLLPDRLGSALFGATWAQAQLLVVPVGVAMVMGGLATGGYAGVRSFGAIRARPRAAVLEPILPLIGIAPAGPDTPDALSSAQVL